MRGFFCGVVDALASTGLMDRLPRVLVIGSLNVDHVFRAPHIPRPGETLAATSYRWCFGGKGANQAVAVARAGGETRFIGMVGDDGHGRAYRDRLVEEGIDIRGLRVASNGSTGSAWIVVDDQGENCIVIHSGANAELAPQALRESENSFEWADGVLMPMESPLETVVEAMALAKRHGARGFLNPSPWTDTMTGALHGVDTLILNRGEAEAWDRVRQAKGVSFEGASVVTQGSAPTMLVDKCGNRSQCPAFAVAPVDTVGAGDAFAGAYVVATLEGRPVEKVLRIANASGALATLKPGAQTAIPTRVEVEAFLRPH